MKQLYADHEKLISPFMKKRVILFILFVLSVFTSCDYGMQDAYDSNDKQLTPVYRQVKTGLLTQNNQRSNKYLINNTDAIADTDAFESFDMLSEVISFFQMPGDLSCDGIDNNHNGVTDEDCIKYLRAGGDTGVYPGYITCSSKRFQMRGYYWFASYGQLKKRSNNN